MTIELQNKAWSVLPKNVRDAIKNKYRNYCNLDTAEDFLVETFGYHNLMSDIEPDEMLIVERKKIQELYCDVKDGMCNAIAALGVSNYYTTRYRDILTSIKEIFGDKCLPDKRPEFKVGDKVKIVNISNPKMRNKIGIITEEHLGEISHFYKVKWDENAENFIEDCYLEPLTKEKDNIEECPYTDDRTCDSCMGKGWCEYKSKSDINEKELNFCELLKDRIGEKFYSPACGIIKLVKFDGDNLQFQGFTSVHFTNTGKIFSHHLCDGSAKCLLYPSKELYEKYPLDAYSAWMEWNAIMKPKYEFVIHMYGYDKDGVTHLEEDLDEFNFKTLDELNQAAEVVKKALEKFYNKKESENESN